jgi:D-alanyl-D-alanine carboxypeptidase (penicillin-binding protein 5/6)
MKFHFYYLLVFFSLLFLFYPGDSTHIKNFMYNRDIFAQEDIAPKEKDINAIPYVAPNSAPQVTAEGAYIVDLPSFTPIYEKNSQNLFYPASTTKVITALVVNDVYKPDDIVTVKRNLQDGQVIGLVVGENISVENLLYGMLVYSGNDAAYAFADFYGYDKFISLMNKKAHSLGMKNTHFANPAGLDEQSQLTTPYDLSLASRELLKNKLLKKIVSTKEITIADNDYKYFHKLTNVNKLLGEVPGIGGLKTGYTEAAGENLVSFYKKNGHDYIIVILKSQDRFTDTKNVASWINDSVRYIKI